MGELALAEAEGVFEVALEHGSIRMFADDREDLLVDSLLVSLALLRGLVLLLLSLKDVSVFLGLLAGVGLDASEVLVVDLVIDLDGGNVQLGGGGQQVALVDAAQGAAVQLKGA